jgi:GAF domain-containing protein
MKLPLFRKTTPYIPTQHREGSLQDIRERILTLLMGSALTLGALALIAAAIPAIRTKQYWSIGVFAVCYVWTLIVTIQRNNFSYTVKVYSLSSIFYILGVINLVQNGLTADAGIFLLSFTVVTCLMIGARSGVFALILSIGTYSLVGFLMSSGSLVPPILTDFREPIDWISGGAVFILLSAILILALNTILKGLNDSIAQIKILAVDTDRDREQLRLRGQDLQRRLAQLHAAADIEHTISAVREPQDLMQKAVDLLRERFGLYHVGVFMFEETSPSPRKTAWDGESDRGMDTGSYTKLSTEVIFQAGTGNIVPVGYRLALSETSNAWRAMSTRKPRSVDAAIKGNTFLTTYLPLAHSELAIPLLSQDRVTGVLMIYSTQSNAFDADDIVLFQSSADNLGIALENARLFKQNQDDLEEIRTLQKQYISRAWSDIEQVHGKLSYTYDVAPAQRFREQQSRNQPVDQTNIAEQGTSTFSTPISLRDQTIGHLTLETNKPAWSNEDRAFIESVITEAALALDNARLLSETQKRAEHDRLIADITRTVQASTDIETILSSAILELGRKLHASEAAISMNVATQDDRKTQTALTGDPIENDDHQDEIGEENPPQPTNAGSAGQEVTA